MSTLFGGRKPAPQQPPQQPPRSPYSRIPPDQQGYHGGSYGREPSSRYYDHPPEKYGYAEPQRSPGKIPPETLKPAESKKSEFQFRNIAPVSPFDFPRERFNPKGFYISLNGFVFTAKQDDGFPNGKVGLTRFQREWLRASLMDDLQLEIYDIAQEGDRNQILGSLDVEIGYAGKSQLDEEFDQDELEAVFTTMFENQILAPGQKILMDFKSASLLFVVKGVRLIDLSMDKEAAEAEPISSDAQVRGILTKESQMTFSKSASSEINLKPSKKRDVNNPAVALDFNFKSMGIGGLDKEISAIFRRAFASRIIPRDVIEAMGIQHVRGILLYGPPGTGKTLIARKIGERLKAREPKVINGPEVLNKFVGQSEENIRKLFADAEKEYKEKRDESGLHIIIFDELDAVCKQRGSGAGGGTGVGDSVVNQLLSKLDGVDQLNNILLIGMTNRMDMIDDALLRPGRLEVHMEISLPDENGRQQILEIHTKTMSGNNRMDPSVKLKELAERTENFSGAEISGLVRSATSFALQRHVKVDETAKVSEDVKDVQVNSDDFNHAFMDVQPAFGASKDSISSCIQGGIIKYAKTIDNIEAAGRLIVQQVRDKGSNPRFRALLWGAPGCGKTALAAQIALNSGFPFIKIITPDDMIGFSETMKKDHMRRIFDDAYKSPESIILIDNIESIIEWVRIGPRFSNPVLQAMKAMLNKQPPKDHQLLVLATATERSVMQELGLWQSFDQKITVPSVQGYDELGSIMQQSQAFRDIDDALNEFKERSMSDTVGIGIKSVLLAIDTAKQDANREMRFASTLADMRAESEFV